jgi:hypothetical protein
MKIVWYVVCLIVLINGLHALNSALEFDGVDDYVYIGSPAEIVALGQGSYTLEAWIKTDAVDTRQCIIGNWDDGSHSFVLELHSTGNLRLYVNANGYNSTVEVDDGLWHHVAGVRDYENSKLLMYVDGVEIYNEVHATTQFNVTNPTRIGRNNDTTYALPFDGLIDEVRVWNDVRSEEEIRQNMYRQLPDPSDASLVAYYQLNGSTDDASSNSYDGNYVGGTASYHTSPAMFGPKNLLDFDGYDDYVNIPDLKISGSAVTLETWVYLREFGDPALDANIANLLRGGDENIVLRIGDGGMPNNMPQFVVKVGGVQYRLNANARLSLNTWYHLACVYDGVNMYMYVDGTLDKVQAQTGSISTTNNPFGLGGAGRNLNGQLDEVRIWSDARTGEEIRENMCRNLTGNEDNLIVCYSFDAASGTVLPNICSNTYDGTLTNMDGNTDWVASSAYNTWLNTSSSEWNTATNWSRGSVPGTSESVGVFSYSGGSDLTISGSPTIRDLTLGASSALTLSSGMTVNGTLALNSNLDLNGQAITLGSAGYLHEDSGRLYGASGTIATTRNLSNIDENVAGLGAEITTAADMGSTVITRSHSANGSPASIQRRYSIEATTNSGLNATLVFHYNDNEINGLTESYLELFRSTDGGANWNDYNGSVNSFANTISLSGIDAFSLWTAMESEDVTPPILETQNPNQNYTSGNAAIVVAPATTVTTSSNIEDATISISPVIAEDVLSVSDLPVGLSSSWDGSTKILSISGTGTAADYQAALRKVKFYTTSSQTTTRTIDFILGDGVGLMIGGEQHFYEVIDNGGNISWENARAAALASRFGDAQGYLATVTSSTENDYLAEKVSADTWIGASDIEREGVWRWADGPETGTQFWQSDLNAGTSATTNYGSAVNGEYAHWWSTEPNNAYGSYGEDCAHMYGSNSGQPGYWNDYYEAYNVRYYIIEYGGDGSTFTTIDDAQVTVHDGALSIMLSSFTATFADEYATLQWTTQSETDNAGWNVYRSSTEQFEDSELITGEMIPGAGNTSQITQYSWQDADELAAGAAYWYWLESVSYSGATETFGPVSLTIPYEEPGQNNPEVPRVYGLMQNHPNPFNPSTEISFVLPQSAHCTIEVFNISGRKIKTLLNEPVAGEELTSVLWQGDDAQGKPVASGIYFYKMRAGKYTATKKMILMK